MAQDYENFDAMLERAKDLVNEDEKAGGPDLSVAEAAEALGLDSEVVHTWCRRCDAFPHAYVAPDGEFRIPFPDVEAMRRGGRLHDLQEPIAEE